MVSWHRILAQNATGWQITGGFFFKGSEKRCKLWQFPHGFFLQQIPCHSEASVLNLPIFFSAARSGWRIPCTIGVAKMHLSKWKVELYIWELWVLVVEGIIESLVFLHGNRITQPAQKTSFRVIYCYACCQPTLFLFLGGLHTAAYPIALSHSWCFLSTMCQRYDQTAKHCRGQGYESQS